MDLFDDNDMATDMFSACEDMPDDDLDDDPGVNPATGWPMVPGSCFDIFGNFYGSSNADDDSDNPFDDSFGEHT